MIGTPVVLPHFVQIERLETRSQPKLTIFIHK